MTPKDAYYFPHDSNSKDDPKCVLLIDQLGLEGYGIFWVLIETLRDQPDYRYPMNLLPALARRYNTTAEKMGTVVRSYGLFTIEDDKLFFSESLVKRMIPHEAKKATATRAAQIRWEKYKSDADAMRTHSECNAEAMPRRVEERIVNKENSIKEKATRFSPPTQEEIKSYCLERKNTIDPERFFNFYQSKGWMVGKNKMKDWKAAVRTWEKDEKQKGGTNESTSKQVYVIPD